MNRIRELREAKGLTQDALGKMIGVQQGAIAKYEAGTRELSITRATQIADALGVELYEVLGLKLGKEA